MKNEFCEPKKIIKKRIKKRDQIIEQVVERKVHCVEYTEKVVSEEIFKIRSNKPEPDDEEEIIEEEEILEEKDIKSRIKQNIKKLIIKGDKIIKKIIEREKDLENVNEVIIPMQAKFMKMAQLGPHLQHIKIF